MTDRVKMYRSRLGGEMMDPARKQSVQEVPKAPVLEIPKVFGQADVGPWARITSRPSSLAWVNVTSLVPVSRQISVAMRAPVSTGISLSACRRQEQEALLAHPALR